MSEHARIPLARAIGDLRSELLNALKEGAGQELHFRLKPIELELQIAVTLDDEVKGAIKFWVVEFGTDTSSKHDFSHKLKLVLEPIGSSGESFEVSSTNASKPSIG